jgi:hypothetical protein
MTYTEYCSICGYAKEGIYCHCDTNKKPVKIINELEFLRWIIAADRSEPYGYGEARTDGKTPDKGQRFLTPRELAEIRLKAIIEKKVT